MSSAPSTFSSICFEQGCWFKEGERKIRGVGEKLVVKRRPSSSMSFRVSANNIALKRIIRIGLLGASGYTGAERITAFNNGFQAREVESMRDSTTRGMQSTIYVEMAPGVRTQDLYQQLKSSYEEEEFVKVVDEGVVPRTHNVRGSNYCFVNVFPDRIPGRAIIISVIDNLVKGASMDNSKHNVAV